ncbi:MAG: diaminopimelate epimerase [Planctomycetes bacterium]|nr:diaminopimelate epimerase [Planctomycetota bacterium]
MRFVKMHGAGNDYVYVDCFSQSVPKNLSALAREMSDRHTGIGADGLILILPSEQADARMRMFNADGSEAEMCGNGIRCVAKYLYDHAIVQKEQLKIETGRGVQELQLYPVGGTVDRVRVNMGPPILNAAEIPTTLPGDPPVNVLLELNPGKRGASAPCDALSSLNVTCVSMGNPHCVTFVEQLSDELVQTVGPLIERHSAFPNRVNVEFVQVNSPQDVSIRVWERGTGETLACGSGASAVVVAGTLTGRTERRITCRLRGGELELEWSASGDVFLTGPAVEVFSGEWPD